MDVVNEEESLPPPNNIRQRLAAAEGGSINMQEINAAKAVLKLDQANGGSVINHNVIPGRSTEAYPFRSLFLVTRSLDLLHKEATTLGADPDDVVLQAVGIYLASRAVEASQRELVKPRRRRGKNAVLPDHPGQTYIPGTMEPPQPGAN